MKIINGEGFFDFWKGLPKNQEDEETEKIVKDIIKAVRIEGDMAVRRFASLYDRSSPENLEVPVTKIKEAVLDLENSNPELVKALRFSAENIRCFSLAQGEQLKDFEIEVVPGVFCSQRVIPVEKAAVYVPGGRFPLISSALMCLIPAFCAGVKEICFSSPPGEDGLPAKIILAAAGIAAEVCGQWKADFQKSNFRLFAIGGAQAIAAFALGTESIPRCDVVAGPGNKYVAAAKRILFGETGIDFIAGPSDILVIIDDNSSIELAAADMLAQAEHDPDARARALVSNQVMAKGLLDCLQSSKAYLNTITRRSLDAGGLIIVYNNMEEALKIAKFIAPEHLELMVSNPADWIPSLKNYGSLFIGSLSAEVLGDYSSGLNHILPTSGSSRFTSGFSLRHFLKTPTTLRCENGSGYTAALEAAEIIARCEGLNSHAESVSIRCK